MTFSYSLLDSDESRGIYTRIIADWVERFRAVWEKRGQAGTPANVERAFKGWWMSKGPANFKTTEDANRFRAELLAAIQADLATIIETRDGDSVSVTVKVKGMDTDVFGSLK